MEGMIHSGTRSEGWRGFEIGGLGTVARVDDGFVGMFRFADGPNDADAGADADLIGAGIRVLRRVLAWREESRYR